MRFRLSEGPRLALAALALVILFGVANRGAYEGFFSDDDLDNLGWTTIIGWDEFARGWWTPRFSEANFRPTGHVFYRVVHSWAGLNFRSYVGAIQVLHLLNTVLVFLLCRCLGAAPPGAMTATAMFLFHPALFAAFWKPMYVFDVTCASFLLLAALLYLRGWWPVSLLCFWFGYKAKEVAIFFPCALALIEAAGARRWWRLAPFFAVSASFGLQAMGANRARDNAYSLRFGFTAICTCVTYYAQQAWVPLLPLAVLARRDRRVWLSVGVFVAMMGPLLILPGRLFAVYLYVPMIALAVAIAFAVERIPAPALAAVGVLWFGYVYAGPLRDYRRAELTIARTSREFFEAVCRVDPSVERKGVAYYEGGPPHMAPHGVEGAIHICYSAEVELHHAVPPLKNAAAGARLFHWQARPPAFSALRNEPSSEMNVFQLGEGWFPWSGFSRWSAPRAEARLWHTPDQNEFHLFVEPNSNDPREIVIYVDNTWIGDARINAPGAYRRSWPVKPPAEAAWRDVRFEIRPPYRVPGDRHEYGLPFVDFRFRRTP